MDIWELADDISIHWLINLKKQQQYSHTSSVNELHFLTLWQMSGIKCFI